MTQFDCRLPNHSWPILEMFIRCIGEKEERIKAGISTYYLSDTVIRRDIEFLEQLGFVNGDFPYQLTDAGKRYFELRFIKNQFKAAKSILRDQLSSFPPAELIIQLLWGVPRANKSNVRSLITSHVTLHNFSKDTLNSFLKVLDHAGAISYNRLTGRVQVLVKPDVEETPQNVFIAPETPYSNIIRLRQVLGECREFIYWLDKHFYKIGLKDIWEVADGAKVQQIHILSLHLKNEANQEDNLNQAAKDEYNRLRKELERKHISLEWRVIESKNIRGTHDRWIIGKKYACNVPNINAIYSGQRSELNRSNNYKEILKTFLSYWDIATPV